MMAAAGRLVVLGLLALGACAAPPKQDAAASPGSSEFLFHARSRKEGAVTESTILWDARKTVVILCDMWDDHTCKGAARRVAAMVPKFNAFLQAARARGALVIHAPSDVIAFYKEYPQRRRAAEAPPARSPMEIIRRPFDPACEGPFPFDNEKWHCDCQPQCPDVRPYPWTRQHPGIEIGPEDAISADGREIWNLMEARGITNVLMTGVHTNYCIVARSFGIRQMVMLKRPVLLVRDMTDSLYNPKDAPFVSHDRGTELVIEHIERYWCPSVLSSDVLGR
ncbi:MAG TPA: protein-signal peptide and transmembrane prediction [Planctomycetota bacterium]|nr:protein-signal peptide and transmembrane prediction [Planctomycetota bacterium]